MLESHAISVVLGFQHILHFFTNDIHPFRDECAVGYSNILEVVCHNLICFTPLLSISLVHTMWSSWNHMVSKSIVCL